MDKNEKFFVELMKFATEIKTRGSKERYVVMGGDAARFFINIVSNKPKVRAEKRIKNFFTRVLAAKTLARSKGFPDLFYLLHIFFTIR